MLRNSSIEGASLFPGAKIKCFVSESEFIR
jgi:hypothetical protein